MIISAVNNLVRTPLRRVPGPLIAKLSKFWILAIELSGRRALYVHALHQRYGPVVRVGPNELSFATAAAARDIYVGISPAASPPQPASNEKPSAAAPSSNDGRPSARAGSGATTKAAAAAPLKTCPKAALYDLARPGVSSIRDEAAHRARLRRVGHSFSVALLPDMEPAIMEELGHMLDALEARQGGAVDMLHFFRMFSLDVSRLALPLVHILHCYPSLSLSVRPNTSLRNLSMPVARRGSYPNVTFNYR